jgi:hypothetical protein
MKKLESIDQKQLVSVTGAAFVGAAALGAAGIATGRWLGNRLAGPTGGAIFGGMLGLAGRLVGALLPI